MKDSVAFIGGGVVLSSAQSALELIASVYYETGLQAFAIDKTALPEAFFDLKTGLAGEILQKFVNYRAKLAVIGDFSVYTSSSLRDFIYESNKGNTIFFVSSRQEAIDKLSRV